MWKFCCVIGSLTFFRRSLAGFHILAFVAWLPLSAATIVSAKAQVVLQTVEVTGEADSAGYVTKRNSTATKTDTPWIETPQAATTVGKEQVRDQQPAKFDEVVRYAPGAFGAIYGPDPRHDWILMRGFKSDSDGIFLDSLQLYYSGYGSFKIQPFALERVDILRGPSSALFGASNPGGIINAISKHPTAEPIRYLEAGVNNYGNRYFNFDFSGPVPLADKGGKLTYRLTGSARAGDTQVDYTQDDNYFIEPALTWQPNLDTTLTILSLASRNESKGLNFLPYYGTVTAAPFGYIKTSTFTGEPASDGWRRDQAMIGYQFEHSFSNAVTFRQNARYAYVDVDFAQYYGAGYANAATGELNRAAFRALSTANQATLDNQLETKFATGALRHTLLFGVDLKNYTLDDYQASGAAPTINVVNPVYAGAPAFSGAPYQDAYLTLRQAGVYMQDQIKIDRFTLG